MTDKDEVRQVTQGWLRLGMGETGYKKLRSCKRQGSPRAQGRACGSQLTAM